MKVLRVVSDKSEVPLAEIRTDGRSLEFLVDNTNGSLPKSTKGSYDRLMQIVQHSSHIRVEEPKEATAHLLRYVLDNGDVVEVTTDGKTALLNGTLLNTAEKNALFQAVKRGDLKVARKADLSKPIPVMPTPTTQPVKIETKGDDYDKEMMVELRRMQKEKETMEEMASPEYDSSIENADLRGSEDPGYVKDMLYTLKHGDSSGRRK